MRNHKGTRPHQNYREAAALQEYYMSTTAMRSHEGALAGQRRNHREAAVLQECYRTTTGVIQECYRSATRVIQDCYQSATGLLQECYSFATDLLQFCYRFATRQHSVANLVANICYNDVSYQIWSIFSSQNP